MTTEIERRKDRAMSMRTRYFAASGLAALGLLATAMPAQADNHAPSVGTAAKEAPACIHRLVENNPEAQYVRLTNDCGKTMRVKIVTSWWTPDTGCNTLRAGKHRDWELEWGAYEKTVLC
jgi:hypothetical protein